MAISINGTSGISGVDGSAGTPALQGTDTNTGIAFGSDVIIGSTGGTERFRCDSSGRMLVGTSTSASAGDAQYAKLQVQGNTSNAAGSALVNLSRGESATSITSGESIGLLTFSDSTGNAFGYIQCVADGTAGTNDYPGRIEFSVTADGASSPTERMRIKSDGEMRMFGANSTCISSSAQGAGTSYVLFYGNYSASSVDGSGTNSVRIFTNGNVQNTNNSYGAISDIKLKENIVDANSQWDDLKALQVRNYNFKEGQTHTQIGLIAQEAELVSPGLVFESPDHDEDGNDLGTVTKSVNYSVLYMKAVKALQEAMERIESLETRLAALEVTP